MEFVIIWALVGLFAARETLPDLTAAVKGNPPPSHERRMKRLEERGQDTSTEKQPGTLREAWRATVKNAAERAAIKREAKHAGTLRHLEENRERLGEQKYNQLKARAAGKQGTVAAFAKIRRLVTETPERFREARAHRRNAGEPDLLDRDDWDPDEGQADANTGEAVTATGEPDASDATVLEFRRRNGTESAARQPLSGLNQHQAEIVRGWRQSNQTYGQFQVNWADWNSLPVEWRALLLDESERAGNTPLTYSADGSLVPVGEIDREAAFLMEKTPGSGDIGPDSETSSDPAQVQTPVGEQAGPDNESLDENGNGVSMAEQTEPTEIGQQDVPAGAEESGPSYETTSLTATLQRLQASSAGCAGQIQDYDQRLARLQAEHAGLGTQISGIEAQIASVQSDENENSGEQVRLLTQAQEGLVESQNQVSEQITHARNTLESYQAAQTAFDNAHAEFSKQVVGQDFYMSQSGAGSKKFLTQG